MTLPDHPPLRVLIVAADPLSRAGLSALLRDLPDMQIVGQLSGDPDWLQHVDTYRPDVLLWDAGWDASPDTFADWPDTFDPGCPLLVLLPDESLVAHAWAIGPAGLLLRTAPPERLAAALQAVADGLIVLDPRFPPDQLRRGASSDPSTDLTPREREVLQLVAEGLSNRAIALRLSISEHTVKFHINAIMEKLGAQSRTEAVVRATRLGLIVL